MRISIDLQACQTEGSAHRGIGRYSMALAKELRHQAVNVGIDSDFLLNASYPLEIPRIKRSLPGAEFDYYIYPTVSSYLEPSGRGKRTIAENLVLQKYARSKGNVVYISSIFEGLSERAVVPRHLSLLSDHLVVATLYDFIPLLMPECYLQNQETKNWYQSCLDRVKECDLLLSISEATRQDAIRCLEISPEKIVNIAGAPNSLFRKINIDDQDKEKVLFSYHINREFLLYTGGIDSRKNIDGLLRGYANLAADLRQQLQLVIVCAIQENEKHNLQLMMQGLGIPEDAVVFTGFIPDDDLVKLYNLCSLFVFPSKYEGLGLPVLEAMRCGAPVIGANNSSIAELIVRKDALFDADDPRDIASTITLGILNSSFSRQLREWGLRRAQDFSWEKTAIKALEAIQTAWKDKCQRKTSSPRKRYHAAMMTPLPPQTTGIAAYAAELLPVVKEHMDVDVFTDTDVADYANLGLDVQIYPQTDFPKYAQTYDVVIYQMGNSLFHAYMYECALRYPGIVVQHDYFLSGLINYMDANSMGETGRFRKTLTYSHGIRALERMEKEGTENVIWEYPMNKELADVSLGMIFHSQFNFELCKRYYGEGWHVPSRHIRQLKTMGNRIDGKTELSIRSKLQIPKDAIVVSSFGFLAPTKLNTLLAQTWAEIRSVLAGKKQDAILVFVGERSGVQPSLEKIVKNDSSIRITGFVPDEIYDDYIVCTDIAVQLRIKSRGETSRAVLDCLASGIPTIVNAYAGFNDYPDNVVKKLSSVPTAQELKEAVLALACSSQGQRDHLGAQGKTYVKEKHNGFIIGKAYADFVHEIIQKNLLTKEKFLQSAVQALRKESCGKDELLRIAQAYRMNFQYPYYMHRIWMFVDSDVWTRLLQGLLKNAPKQNEAELCHVCWQNNEMHRIREDESIAERQMISLGDTVLLSCRIADTSVLRYAMAHCANIYLYEEPSFEGVLPIPEIQSVIMGLVRDQAAAAGKAMVGCQLPVYSWEDFFDREYRRSGRVNQIDETEIGFNGTAYAAKIMGDEINCLFTEQNSYPTDAWQGKILGDGFSVKHRIRQNILKPGYYWLSGFSPALAEKIRAGLMRIKRIF